MTDSRQQRKIVLVSPPAGAVRRGENLGIRYLASLLLSHGHDVEMVEADLAGIDIEGVVSRLHGCDLAGFSLNYSEQFRTAREIVGKLTGKNGAGGRSAARKIIAGGHYATFQADFVLSSFPELDAVVLGEGEHILLELLDGGFERPESVAGLAFRNASGVICRSRERIGVTDIDSFPFPLRDSNSSREGFTMISSRGCYGSCAFCSVASFSRASGLSRSWRTRSPENIIEEIVGIREKWGVDAISFVDDVFVGPDERSRRRAERFCDLLKEQQIDLRFSIACKADAVEPVLFGKLAAAGLKSVCIGFESGQDKALACFNKKVSADRNAQALDVLRQLNLNGDHGFILFYPEMDYGDFMVNLDFLYRTGLLDSRQLCSRLVILYGTPYCNRDLDGVEVEEDGVTIRYVFKDSRLERLHTALRAVHEILEPAESKVAKLTYYLDTNDHREGSRELRSAVDSMRRATAERLYCLAKKLFRELEHDNGFPGVKYAAGEATKIRDQVEGVADFTRAAAEGRLGEIIKGV